MQKLSARRPLALGLLMFLAVGSAHAAGTLRVDIQPDNSAGARVVIARPGIVRNVTADQTLSLPAGQYSVVVIAKRRVQPIVDDLLGVANKAVVSIVNNQTQTVTANYNAVKPGSGRLWLPIRLNDQVQSFGRPRLTAGTDGPSGVVITGAGSEPISSAFDARGNMWVASFADNTLLKYNAAKLVPPGGSRAPDVIIRSDGQGSLNGPLGLAFDARGNLWVGNFGPQTGDGGAGDNTLVRFTPGQLTVSGQPTPGVILTGFDNPYGHAFDRLGNLWVGNNRADNVLRFTPAQLAQSGAAGPANIKITETLNGGVLNGPRGPTFDSRGRLWIASAGNQRVAGYTIEGATATAFATVILRDEAGGPVPSPDGLAFDNGNNLWVGSTDGNLYRYARDELAEGGTIRPLLTISGFGAPQAIRGVLFSFNPAPRRQPVAPAP